MLLGWTLGRMVREVEAALSPAGDGWIAVVDRPRLARALSTRRSVVAVGSPARGLRRMTALVADAGHLPLRSGGLAGVVTPGSAEDRLAEWTRPVRDGGVVLLLDRLPEAELMRRALTFGLVDLEQRSAGGVVITSGRVRHFGSPH